MTRIAILGAGNGGCAAAADLSMHGHSVALYELPEFADSLVPIKERGGIEIIDEGFAELDTITTDIAEAMSGASYVFNPVPAFAHQVFAGHRIDGPAERCEEHEQASHEAISRRR